ncbi:MAG TPA: CPBP family intramembrane glutamic endopeptidase [Phycisphaerales bacterium]|nr:CPBP family intramembrane glutamic endopeptidase [Phycisphaerales bacterium]
MPEAPTLEPPAPAITAPPPLPWHQRPWGILALGVAIIAGSWLCAWIAGLLHWYTWSIGYYDHALSHEANRRVFEESPSATILSSLVMQGSAVMLALVFVQARNPERPTPADLWITPTTLRPALWPIVILGSLGVLYVSGYATQWLSYFGLLPETSPRYDAHYAAVARYEGPWAILAVLVMALTAGIGEEIVCRGYILKGLLRSWRPFPAILASSLLFAAAHFDPLYAISVLPIGMWFGYLAVRTRSITLAITTHILIDLYGIGLYTLPRSLQDHTAFAVFAWAVFVISCLCIIPAVLILERHQRATTVL